MSMPRTIYLPRPEDFCRHHLEGPEGTCCFMGWYIKLFRGEMTFEEEQRFEEVAMRIAKKMRLKRILLQVHPLAQYNDHYDNSPRRLATWFEKTVEALGYDITRG